MRVKFVEGVGINDADYEIGKPFTSSTGAGWSRCPYYDRWKGILRRGYSSKEKSRHLTYIDCIVCEEWKRFSVFKSWMESQEWEGRELDKDILVKGNKSYSPDTCRFVPRELNNLLLGSAANRGDFPLGVSIRKGYTEAYQKPYASRVKEFSVLRHLGCYKTAIEAHQAWQLGKALAIERTVAWYALQLSFDTRVAETLMVRVWDLRNDHQLKIETKSL